MSFLTGSSPTTTIDYQDPLRPPGYGFAGGLFGQLPGLWGQQFPSYQGMWNPSLNPSLQMSSSMAQGRSISPAPEILGQAQGALGGFMTPWGLSSAQNRLSELGSPSYQNPMMRSQQGYPDWFGGGGWGGGGIGGMGGMGGGSWLFPYFGGIDQAGGFMGGGGIDQAGGQAGLQQGEDPPWWGGNPFYGDMSFKEAQQARQWWKRNAPELSGQYWDYINQNPEGYTHQQLYDNWTPPWQQFGANPEEWAQNYQGYNYYDPTGEYGAQAQGAGGRPRGTYTTDPINVGDGRLNRGLQASANFKYKGGGGDWWQNNFGQEGGGVDLGAFANQYGVNLGDLRNDPRFMTKGGNRLNLTALRKAAKSGAF